ncbi:MAG: response regulator [Desulfobacterales bacterium]|jgi:DNA-binding response OmpR family regulator|nr:response regulator [Desulfobacterales bacterium]
MSPKKILIVDDEVDLVETVRFPLELEGFDVLVSYNGEDALNQARKEKPDLIILDLMLPKLDGYKVCRLLKFDERYKHIPILMLTAKTQEKDKILGKETGADEYITKPFEMDYLMEKVKAYLNK